MSVCTFMYIYIYIYVYILGIYMCYVYVYNVYIDLMCIIAHERHHGYDADFP